MDLRKIWAKELEWPFPYDGLEECNIVVHSDGGTRGAICSASAWIVEDGILRGSLWEFRPLAMGGTFFADAISSFQAETLALDECTLFLRRLVEHYMSQKPHGKRRMGD